MWQEGSCPSVAAIFFGAYWGAHECIFAPKNEWVPHMGGSMKGFTRDVGSWGRASYGSLKEAVLLISLFQWKIATTTTQLVAIIVYGKE